MDGENMTCGQSKSMSERKKKGHLTCGRSKDTSPIKKREFSLICRR